MHPAKKSPTPAAKRKRLQRRREREREQFIYERSDWRLFTDLSTLPQKAGCHAFDIRRIVLKELVDNALDSGANVTCDRVDGAWVISDDGPGLDPKDVPKLFCVNRPMRSSKLKRLPLRGMLGNGLRVVMGYVAAIEGAITVETRGHRLTMRADTQTGATVVTSNEAIEHHPGTKVRLVLDKGDQPRGLMGLGFGWGSGGEDEKDVDMGGLSDMDDSALERALDPNYDAYLVRETIEIAKHGKHYAGPSSPWWYGEKAFHQLYLHAPPDVTAGELCKDLGLEHKDVRLAETLTIEDCAAILSSLRSSTKRSESEDLGYIGHGFRSDYPGYAPTSGFLNIDGAELPFVVEVWAYCERSEGKGENDSDVPIHFILNRSLTAVRLFGVAKSKDIFIKGCGFHRKISLQGAGNFTILLGIVSPHFTFTNDGKEPDLTRYSEFIAQAVKKACNAAYQAMEKPQRKVTIKDAAWSLMPQAYRIASGNGTLPAHARQVMYAARKGILNLTGMEKLDDKRFTNEFLPDYITAHPEETQDWVVVYDARGHLIEPHTGRQVALGTVEVRSYLGERPLLGPSISLTSDGMYPTTGPKNRYSTILFVEKEGFMPLLKTAQIAERFDIAIMSTKGMSVIAARSLLDQLSPHLDKVLVLHDFDVSGFSIFGTLGTDGRRYTFQNQVPIVDIGLRLSDVEEWRLESEPVKPPGDWEKTLRKHGATDDERDFLRDKRVELNAMPAPVFIDFLERKLAQHGISKVIPSADTVERHARRIVEKVLVEKALQKILPEIQKDSAAAPLPNGLLKKIEHMIHDNPQLSWDQAAGRIVRESI